MKKIIKYILVLLFTILVIPHYVQATDTNMLEEQLKQETNEIISILEEQKNNPHVINSLIMGLFGVVIISMIFEGIVKNFKYEIKEKNKNNENTTELKKKLWITYGIHIVSILILFVVCKYIVKILDLYNIFFILISVCMVEIGPFLQIRMKKKNRRDNDTTH